MNIFFKFIYWHTDNPLLELTLEKLDIYSVIIHIVIISLILLLTVLITIAFYILAERKIIASAQRRLGPSTVGFWGMLQSIADGVKLLLKEVIIPSRANKKLFIGASIWALGIGLTGWAIIPFSSNFVIANVNLSILYLLAISSLGVYGIILAGWSSNSKYAFLGALRSTAQMISYEVSLSLVILPVGLLARSYNFYDIIEAQRENCWYILPLFPIAIIFFISSLAETNRAPFDLPEAEAEIVAGYNVEYSSMLFAFFFLAEYSNMLLLSAVMSLCFLGGWLSPLPFLFNDSIFWYLLKMFFIAFLFIHVRVNFPRLRYDQLMNLGWKWFLPISLAYIMLLSGLVFQFNLEHFSWWHTYYVLACFIGFIYWHLRFNLISKIVKEKLAKKDFAQLKKKLWTYLKK